MRLVVGSAVRQRLQVPELEVKHGPLALAEQELQILQRRIEVGVRRDLLE